MGNRDLSEQRVPRRLTAILAADVVGCSRFMGKDEELWGKGAHRGIAKY